MSQTLFPMKRKPKSRPSFSGSSIGPETPSKQEKTKRAEGAKNPRSLNCCKNTNITIASYNCRSISNQARLSELEEELNNIKWDIVGIGEVRRKDEELTELQSGHLLYHQGTPNGRTSGVGFLIHKNLKNRVIQVFSISDRVASVTLRISSRYTMQIIQVYAPTSSHSDEEIEGFYEEVTQALDKENCHFKYLIGDFNSKVGKKQRHESAVGNYGIGERNERGERLVQFAEYTNMSIMNTFFKKNPNKKWTWESPNGNIRNEIDFIITNKRNTIKDVTVLNRFNTGSDHRLIRAKIQINTRMERLKLVRRPNTIRIDMENLARNEEEFQRVLNSKIVNVDDPMNQLMDVIKNTAIEVGGTARIKINKKLSDQTKHLLHRRRNMKNRIDNTNRIEYVELCKTIRKKIAEDSKKYNEQLVKDAIENQKSHKKAKQKLMIGKKQIVALVNNETRITHRESILEYVAQYYENLYKALQPNNSLPKSKGDPPEVLTSEVNQALKEMKNGKAAGNDGITVELLKLTGTKILTCLARMYTSCLKDRRIPKHWNSATIILLHKKGSKEDIKNYRPISLLPVLYKVFTKIINNRIQSALDAAQPREQAGFRSGFSTTDHIQVIREVISRTKEYTLPLALAFIDFEKAFDSVTPTAVMEALLEQGIDKYYVETLSNIYKEATAVVKLHENTAEFPTSRGVRQGDSISPKLFSATLEKVFRKLEWENQGLKINGEYLNHLRFADDIVLIANSPDELQRHMDELNQASHEVGLRMNLSKTKVMFNEFITREDITIDGKSLEEVEEYIYLGQQIHISGSLLPEIQRRIKLGWMAYGRNNIIFKSTMPLHLKKKAFDQCILPALTYGCETWTLSAAIIQKLQVTQRSMERSMLGITRRDRKTVGWIRERTKVTDIIQRIKSLKWKWAGHIARRKDNRWTTRIIEWYPRDVKRPRKRPQDRWDRDIQRTAGATWFRSANNRASWRELGENYIH